MLWATRMQLIKHPADYHQRRMYFFMLVTYVLAARAPTRYWRVARSHAQSCATSIGMSLSLSHSHSSIAGCIETILRYRETRQTLDALRKEVRTRGTASIRPLALVSKLPCERTEKRYPAKRSCGPRRRACTFARDQQEARCLGHDLCVGARVPQERRRHSRSLRRYSSNDKDSRFAPWSNAACCCRQCRCVRTERGVALHSNVDRLGCVARRLVSRVAVRWHSLGRQLLGHQARELVACSYWLDQYKPASLHKTKRNSWSRERCPSTRTRTDCSHRSELPLSTTMHRPIQQPHPSLILCTLNASRQS